MLEKYIDDILSNKKIITCELIKNINENYSFTNTGFYNGKFEYNEDEKQEFCKLLAFGKINNLSKFQMISCLDNKYLEKYKEDAEIFKKIGWSGVLFFISKPLKKKD